MILTDDDKRHVHFTSLNIFIFSLSKGCSFVQLHKVPRDSSFSELVNWKCFFFNLIVDYSNCTPKKVYKVSVCKSLRGAIVSMISHSLHVASCHHSFLILCFAEKKTFIGLCILGAGCG